ncbi:MAG: glycosyltransferase family 2 protein [Acetobacter peroxydans]|jgi:hypothetical protein|nr:glycosyltransferase family 2 protein [Acetobacter peroxydans]
MHAKIAIVAIAKNEAAYLPHWIAHHLFFGFDEFHVWINGTTDNSVTLMEKIGKIFPNVYTHDGDVLLKECQRQAINFQEEAYARTLSILRNNGDITHVLFLDIDEFWTPSAFCGSVQDSVRNIHADVISFLWHVDVPDYDRPIFSEAFVEKCFLQKDVHVKSMVKLSSAIVRCHIHTSNVKNGAYALGNGLSFPASEDSVDFDVEAFSKVSENYLNKAGRYVDASFIYHRVNRSTTEYLSSLLRGRTHALDNSLFKTNRIGYINQSTRIVDFIIPKDNLEKYRGHYVDFVELCGIAVDMDIPLNNIEKNYNYICDIFNKDRNLVEKYKNIFRGINQKDPRSAPPEYKAVKSFVDEVFVNESLVIILGWAFSDVSSVVLPKVFVANNNCDYTFEIVDRLDVKQKYGLYNSGCGFRIKIELAKDLRPKKEDISIIF